MSAFDIFKREGKRKKAEPSSEQTKRRKEQLYRASHSSKEDPINKQIDTPVPDETIQFDNADELEHAFKKGSVNWPKFLMVNGIKYTFIRSSKSLVNVIKNNQPGYMIYATPQTSDAKAKELGMGQWMVFLFKADGPSRLVPQAVTFTSKARGEAMYEAQQEVIGDIALLKIALPSGVIALKGKVDTGAEISSLHVDSKPQVVGDIVKFENHNASSNVISAPLVANQAVKSADGGVEYRPVIELDIEINGKQVSKAQFNLNNRSKMEHEVLIGQNILEKTGFLVDPNINDNNMKEGDELEDLSDYLSEEEEIELMIQLSEFADEEDNTEE